MNYAGFWIRFSAFIIDILALLPVSLIYALFAEENYGFAYLLSLVVGWLYSALFESGGWQATPGKRVLGIKVTDLYGSRISFGRASGRHFAKYITGFTLGIGYLMILWTERKQALHDKIAGTLVILGRRGSVPLQNDNLRDDNKTKVIFTGPSQSSSASRWILAGFDSSGHVVRIGFDFDDPRLYGAGLVIGRDSISSDIHIKDSSISRRHARLFKRNDDVWLEDLESTNGILINGVSLPQGESAPLMLKGTLTLGGIIFTIGKD